VTYRDTFIGRLNRYFDWSNPNDGLTSKDIEFLTGSLMDSKIFEEAVQRARTRAFRHLDWGSTVVGVTKQEVLALMAHWVPGDELPGPGDENHKPKQSRARSLATVRALPDDGSYVLVTEEF